MSCGGVDEAIAAVAEADGAGSIDGDAECRQEISSKAVPKNANHRRQKGEMFSIMVRSRLALNLLIYPTFNRAELLA